MSEKKEEEEEVGRKKTKTLLHHAQYKSYIDEFGKRILFERNRIQSQLYTPHLHHEKKKTQNQQKNLKE